MLKNQDITIYSVPVLSSKKSAVCFNSRSVGFVFYVVSRPTELMPLVIPTASVCVGYRSCSILWSFLLPLFVLVTGSATWLSYCLCLCCSCSGSILCYLYCLCLCWLPFLFYTMVILTATVCVSYWFCNVVIPVACVCVGYWFQTVVIPASCVCVCYCSDSTLWPYRLHAFVLVTGSGYTMWLFLLPVFVSAAGYTL